MDAEVTRYVPPEALRAASLLIGGSQSHNANFGTECERRWPADVWREAVRQVIRGGIPASKHTPQIAAPFTQLLLPLI